MLNLHYHEWGERGQVTILFLHGFMGSGADWATVAELLGSNYHTLAPDLPGHGRSYCADPTAFTLPNAAASIIALLDAQKITRCRLVGYSMGGRLALYLAIHYPERFTHLLLESASPGISDAPARAARQRWDAEIADKLTKLPLNIFLEQWYAMPLFASFCAHPDFAHVLIRRQQNDPQQLALSMRMMGTGSQPSLWGVWARLGVPTRLVVGALDGKYVGISAEMVASQAAKKLGHEDTKTRRDAGESRRIVLPNVGHNTHFEHPAAFVATLWDE